MNRRITAARGLAGALRRRGVERMFGIPGGGASLELIDAAAAEGIDFVLARGETAAVIMAAATAELSGTLGVALTTRGPGVAGAANGVAHAFLDRCPVMVVTECLSAEQGAFATHQAFDQPAMLAPVVKGYGRPAGADAAATVERLAGLAMAPPAGPVHLELTDADGPADGPADAPADGPAEVPPPIPEPPSVDPDNDSVAGAREVLAAARRPVVIAGLEARPAAAAAAVVGLIDELGCPALTTYKAKGVVADGHRCLVGLFTGASGEEEWVSRADLVVLLGLDPVELIPRPWPYRAPVLDVAATRHPVHHVTPAAGLYGPLAESIGRLRGASSGGGWSAAEIAALGAGMRRWLDGPRGGGLGPREVVEAALGRSGGRPRVTVDAGAHMFPVMALWRCRRPGDVLISNGLSTMAFALPAAIAAALHQPDRPVIAFTGDGGLMMCLGELSTAARHRAAIVVVVFNDGALSLIDVKQRRRGLARRGVDLGRHDFARAAEGLGCRGWRADTPEAYAAALDAALDAVLAGGGPALIDVRVDPQGYGDQFKALRG